MLLKSWPCHFKAVACLAITTCGTFLVSGGKDALVHVWTLLECVGSVWRAPRPQMSHTRFAWQCVVCRWLSHATLATSGVIQ